MCTSGGRSRTWATCHRGSRMWRRCIVEAIRDACPGIIVNQTTGVIGDDITGPLKCLAAVRPEIAALNAGSLNYLKTRSDGTWAWPPLLFDNPVDKIRKFLQAMRAKGIDPEFECFDLGMVRTAAAIGRNCGYDRPPKYNLVMGVESGMPADPELLTYPPDASSRPSRAGASPRSDARRSGRCTDAPQSSAAICAPASRTRSICPTARAPRRTAISSRRWSRWPAQAGRAVASPEEARVALRLSQQPKEALS